MKPDQHKEKKNAEYKKKHGMEKQNKNDSAKSGYDHKSRTRRKTSEENKHLKRESKENKKEDDQDYDEHQYFSRCQIESNWERYEEEELGESFENDVPSVSKIGADFQVLLDKAAGSTSQFHFEGEKEWENLHEHKDHGKAGSGWMSVDCSSLAHALRKISLEKRLEIDKKYFEDEDLDKNKTSSGIDKPTPLMTNNNLSTEVNYTTPQQNYPPKIVNIPMPNELSQSPVLKEYNPEVQIQHASSTNQKALLNASRIVDRDTNNGEEMDLEHLLGLDSAGKVDNRAKMDQEKKLKHDTKVAASGNKVNMVPQAMVTQDTKEDLEDWLDSILD